jgi:hypothetical protein
MSRDIIDPAEFLALRSIVMSLVGAMADQNEKSTGISKETFMDGIAKLCRTGIEEAAISGPDPERFRSAAIEHVIHILGGITFDDTGAD